MDTSVPQQIVINAITELAPVLALTLASLNESRLAALIYAKIQPHFEALKFLLSNLSDIRDVNEFRQRARSIAYTMSLPSEVFISHINDENVQPFIHFIHFIQPTIRMLANADDRTISNMIAQVIKDIAPALREKLSDENISQHLSVLRSELGRGQCDALLSPLINLIGVTNATSMANELTSQAKTYITELSGTNSFFNKHKAKLAVAGVGLTGGTYCALVLAGVITGAAAISPALAIAGLTIAALLILAGVAALVKDYCAPFNRPAPINVEILFTPSPLGLGRYR